MKDTVDRIIFATGGGIRISTFLTWRGIVGEMTGLPVSYGPAGLSTAGSGRGSSVPEVLEIWRARMPDQTLTADERRGRWTAIPDDPLLVLLCLTVPGGCIDPLQAEALAARLDEIGALMWAIDDGRRTILNIGGITEHIRDEMRAIAASGSACIIDGDYYCTGRWDVSAMPDWQRAE